MTGRAPDGIVHIVLWEPAHHRNDASITDPGATACGLSFYWTTYGRGTLGFEMCQSREKETCLVCIAAPIEDKDFNPWT